MKEVKEKRYAGPFENPPFEHFIIQSAELVGAKGQWKKYKINIPPIIPQEK